MFGGLLNKRTKAAIASDVDSALKGKIHGGSVVFKYTLMALLLFSLVILGILLAQVIAESTGILTERFGNFLSGTLRSRSEDQKLGIFQGLTGSLWIAIFVALLSFPLGIASAIYLEEYAPKNKLTSFIEINIRNLAGVPSVVYGLLGLFLFVNGFDVFILRNFRDFLGGSSLASAGLTMSILTLPIVIITSQEAIRAVPSWLREGAHGVGADKWQVVRTQVLPYAAPGILTGTLLSMSRAIGEAAPLILVGAITGRLGTSSSLFDVSQLGESFTAMPIIITSWTSSSARDAGFTEAAAAAIVVLLVFVLIINAAAIFMRNHFEKKRSG